MAMLFTDPARGPVEALCFCCRAKGVDGIRGSKRRHNEALSSAAGDAAAAPGSKGSSVSQAAVKPLVRMAPASSKPQEAWLPSSAGNPLRPHQQRLLRSEEPSPRHHRQPRSRSFQRLRCGLADSGRSLRTTRKQRRLLLLSTQPKLQVLLSQIQRRSSSSSSSSPRPLLSSCRGGCAPSAQGTPTAAAAAVARHQRPQQRRPGAHRRRFATPSGALPHPPRATRSSRRSRRRLRSRSASLPLRDQSGKVWGEPQERPKPRCAYVTHLSFVPPPPPPSLCQRRQVVVATADRV